jgi:starch synthase
VDIPRSDSGTLGGTTHVVEVARNLSNLGMEVTIFCRGKGRGKEWVEHENLQVRRFYRGDSITVSPEYSGLALLLRRIARPPFLWARRLQQSIEDAIKIVSWLRANKKIDVIYERVNRFSVAGTIASKFLGIPLVAEVNDLNFHDISLKRASAVVVPDPLSLKPKFRIKSFKLPWGVDTERIRPMAQRQDISERLGILNFPTVLFVGSFLPWHGAVSLVKAASAVHADHPLARFVMIGAGPDEARTRETIHNLGLAKYFVFTGFVPHDEISQYLSIGDVMVAPYTNELEQLQGRAEMGRSFKVLEYMAAAKPVVVTAVANQSGPVEHDKTGIIVADNKPEALAKAISYLLSNETLAKTMGEKGRLAVEEHHTWLRHAEAVRDIFQNVVSQK